MHSNYLVRSSSAARLARGFGLVELLVSISVMVLVTSIILARHDSFNGATLLRSQAYDVALALREMQQLAVSTSNVTGDFRGVYGIVFDKIVAPNDYIIFRDNDGDGSYDGGEEFGKQGTLDERFLISSIEFLRTAPAVNSNEDDVTILFERPNFDALFYDGSGVAVNAGVYGVKIGIGVRGSTEVRYIEITRTGQITVIE